MRLRENRALEPKDRKPIKIKGSTSDMQIDFDIAPIQAKQTISEVDRHVPYAFFIC